VVWAIAIPVVLAVLLGGVALVIFLVQRRVPDTDGQGPVMRAPVPQQAPRQAPAEAGLIDVSAEHLVAAYTDNEAKANHLYRGKSLRVTGVVRRVTEKAVELQGGGLGVMTVDCHFSESWRKLVSSLFAGTRVTIRGVCDGKNPGAVDLKDCILIAAGG
jgi:hypothetical protein